MKRIKFCLSFTLLLIGFCLSSCQKDDEFKFSDKSLNNSELKTILLQKGYEFNDRGNLLINDLVRQTVSLDLSETKITNLSGLELFPNLKELNLSKNGYGPVFDFSVLPDQITGVDLRGNPIRKYDNLIQINISENGDETVVKQRSLTKLYLPAEARDNMTDIVRFYRHNKASNPDIQMENTQSELEPYTTLRTIPDASLRTWLKTQFSDLFEGESIDIAKRIGNSQRSTNIYISPLLGVTNIGSLEGIQYIVENPYWEGTTILIALESPAKMPPLSIGKSVTLFQVSNLIISEEGLDFASANSLTNVSFNSIRDLKNIDLRQLKIWGQRGVAIEKDPLQGSQLSVVDCPDVAEISLPAKKNLDINMLALEGLPKLKILDLSGIEMVNTLSIGDLSATYKLIYPELTVFSGVNNQTYFSCTKSIYDRASTKAFIDKFYTKATPKKLGVSLIMQGSGEGYLWWQ